MMDTTYNVGIYCRLSNDDERDGESVSIENQDGICQGYFHPKVSGLIYARTSRGQCPQGAVLLYCLNAAHGINSLSE